MFDGGPDLWVRADGREFLLDVSAVFPSRAEVAGDLTPGASAAAAVAEKQGHYASTGGTYGIVPIIYETYGRLAPITFAF